MATGTTAEQIIDVVTPAAGESVTEGTILEWHVKVGDAIKVDETIVEISTDKVDVELPAPGERHRHRDARRGGRHGHRRPGDRADRRRAPAAARRAAAASDGNGSASDSPQSSAAPEDDAAGHRAAPTPTARATPATASAGRRRARTARRAGRLVDVVTPAAGESVTRGDDPRMAREGRRLHQGRRRRSSRSPPTRSTSSCPPRRAARSASCSCPRATRSPSAR